MGKNSGPILSHLWTKVHDILRRCRRPFVVANTLADCLYPISLRKYRPLKLPLSCKVVKKGGFGAPFCRERVYSRFQTYIFTSQSLPSMWPVLVEFRSGSSEGS